MLRLAFCDDDTTMFDRLRACAERCVGDGGELRFFSDPEALLQRYREQDSPFDAVFLDIEMPGCSGMELAGAIRKVDKQVLLVFVTTHEQFVFQAFEVEAFRYIPKGRLEQALPAALEAVRKRLLEAPERSYVLLKSKGAQVRLALGALVYLEKRGKYCIYHPDTGGELPVRQTIREAQDTLPEGLFVQIQSGILVNMRRISSLEWGEVVLTDGVRLPVSRLRGKEVNRAIHRFWSDTL